MHPTYSIALDSGWGNLALTSNQLGRRWREYHPLKSKTILAPREEELWRGNVLKCLSAAHTPGNVAEMSFEVVKSLYSVSRYPIYSSELPLTLTNLHRPD